MTHRAVEDTALQDGGTAGWVAVPDVAVRIAGAMLALAVAAVSNRVIWQKKVQLDLQE